MNIAINPVGFYVYYLPLEIYISIIAGMGHPNEFKSLEN